MNLQVQEATSSRRRKDKENGSANADAFLNKEATVVDRTLDELFVDPQNVRHGGKKTPDPKCVDDAFVENIFHDGVLVPLIVRKGGGIVAGGRRFAALLALAKAKRITDEHPVRCVEYDLTDAEATELSIAENIHREDMHPVQEFRAFAALKANGAANEAIAARHAMTLHAVEQVLRLGEVAPLILDAWIEGKINKEAVQAFTLASTHEQQTTTFARLKKRGSLHAFEIRKELVGDGAQAKRLLKLVGRDVYEKAGGTFIADLFAKSESADVVPNSIALLTKLKDDKIAAKIEELKVEGWGWAEYDLIGDRYVLDQTRKAKPDKTLGCFVIVNDEGKLEVGRGFKKSRAHRIESTKAPGSKPKLTTTLSDTLDKELQAQFASAVKRALVKSTPKAKLAALLAQIVSGLIRVDFLYQTPDDVRRALSKVADLVDPSIMNDALADEFDAKDFFTRAPKGLVVKACEAMSVPKGGLKGGTPLKDRKRGDLVKLAAAGANDTGWLPKELRAAGYSGPGR